MGSTGTALVRIRLAGRIFRLHRQATELVGVRSYIQNRKDHHRRMTWEEELKGLLDRAGIPYDPQIPIVKELGFPRPSGAKSNFAPCRGRRSGLACPRLLSGSLRDILKAVGSMCLETEMRPPETPETQEHMVIGIVGQSPAATPRLHE